MGTFESLNIETMETPEDVKLHPSENLRREMPEIKNKWLYLAIPVIAIAFAELMIYSGNIIQAMGIHALILLGLSFSTMFVKNEEIQKTYQALILLPILRLVDLSMPVFYDVKLYNLIFIYGLLVIPVSIAATNQEFTRTQLGITFRKIWIYIPLSIVLGLLLGTGEYLIAGKHLLIGDLSVFSLLMLSIIMIFFVGLVEETIYRSILQNRLETAFGNRKGLIITSILFGLMHSGYGNINEIVYTFLIGIFIGYLFYRTRSLPLVALTHGFINVFFFGIIPLLF
ncbi:CPBP family intramembrane glutamic endopeptidase [Methanosarcina sp. Z-7115]|uniref:CPBP family intramembrane glutamic endopeptidase n=1 Tax=Methanosarcina baikalica TaxID=3073890 RepID=A0ABU2D517_9EURY|nr:CPBP family intramembrane glutamic endopeptidase [Methanosarcina sp. Z-7115]MDR7667074.1 CPBP family intramembrane glutamic endopeptidase [Methanosarcina sp. Z-7115]